MGTVVQEAATPPATLSDPLPDSPELEQQRGRAVLYRVPYEFERVYRRAAIGASRKNGSHDCATSPMRLRSPRDPIDPEPALVLPEPGRGVNSTTLPGTRLFALRNIPHEAEEFREWELANFPDPGRSLLAERLERSFQTGARHVQTLLLVRIGR